MTQPMNSKRNVEILFQNNETGTILDLAPVTTQVTYSTKRRGEPGKLEISVVTDTQFPAGSPVALRVDGEELFYGYLFKRNQRKDHDFSLTFYDQLKYMLRSNTWIFKDETLDGIIQTIANDFELEVGELVDTETVLPSTVKDEKKALDVVEECISQHLVETGEMLVFWDNFGKLTLDYPRNLLVSKMLADGSIISDFDYESNIEESSNVIKLVHDNPDSGLREVYLFQDSNNIDKWGKLQFTKIMDEKSNEAQIEAYGDMYLELYNKEHETVTLEFSIGDFEFRAGKAVYVDVAEAGLRGWYLLDSVTHEMSASNHSMSVDLWLGGSTI